MNILERQLHLTWEDFVFGVYTVVFLVLPKNLSCFHLYTIGVIILTLSLVFRRGLAVGSVRMMGLVTALIFLRRIEGPMPKPPLMEVAILIGGGMMSGILGEMQRKSKMALEQSFHQTLNVLARALECRDPYTEGHSRRTAGYAVALARTMGMDEETQIVIERAGLLHDLGKMGMPDTILHKNGTLTSEEETQVKRHPEEGSHILEDIPFLAKAAVLVKHHHEHFDGSGYPDGLSGDAIPLGARVLTVADAFDALTTDRPYRKASDAQTAIAMISAGSGRLFDPEIVQVLERTFSGTMDVDLPKRENLSARGT